MPDLLVKLYDLPQFSFEKLKEEGVTLKRAHIIDKNQILEFVKKNFSEGWVNECEHALTNHPSTCYIAVKEKEILGFACYEATGKDFFGPIGIKNSERGKGIGKALLLKCLYSMREMGYAYAIIGWVGDAIGFYEKEVGATIIEGSNPSLSIYQNLIRIE